MKPTRATVYLERAVHRALKIKAAETSAPISELVNRAVKLSLREDDIDLEAFDEREREPARSFQAVLKDLRRARLI